MTLTTVLAALSDPIRLQLVQTLADGGEKAWGELSAPVAKSTLSHHLKVLRSAGLTRTRQEGTRCFVWLRTDDLEEQLPRRTARRPRRHSAARRGHRAAGYLNHRPQTPQSRLARTRQRRTVSSHQEGTAPR
ncbi:MAG: metalloregulator ArsR/SmtB family transcription factor [Nocardioidaceae bacterium]